MWYFRLIQFALIILLLLYYGGILIEVFSNGKIRFTEHDLNDRKIWIPFYVWFVENKKKSK
jgi:hypothetical protein